MPLLPNSLLRETLQGRQAMTRWGFLCGVYLQLIHVRKAAREALTLGSLSTLLESAAIAAPRCWSGRLLAAEKTGASAGTPARGAVRVTWRASLAASGARGGARKPFMRPKSRISEIPRSGDFQFDPVLTGNDNFALVAHPRFDPQGLPEAGRSRPEKKANPRIAAAPGAKGRGGGEKGRGVCYSTLTRMGDTPSQRPGRGRAGDFELESIVRVGSATKVHFLAHLLVFASPPLGRMRPAARHCSASDGLSAAAAGWRFAHTPCPKPSACSLLSQSR